MNGQEQSGDLRAAIQRERESERKPDKVSDILSMVDVGEKSGLKYIMNDAAFERMWRAAKVYADSDLTPRDFRGKPGNVFIAMNLAQRFKVDFFMLMQNMYIVHGRPGLEAKLMIALVNASGTFTGPIQWRMERLSGGRIKSMTAYAKHSKTGEECSATVDVDIVTAFGWDRDKKRKDGGVEKSKWVQMPEQMYSYRSAAFLIRKYCPEVILGLSTTDELQEIEALDTPVTAPAPRYNTVGEISVYAASIGVPDEDFAEMTRTVGITRKKITHTEDKLDALATLVDAWQPQAPAPVADPEPTPRETIPADAPPPPVEDYEGKSITVIDKTGEDDVPDNQLRNRPVITKRGVGRLLTQAKQAGLDEAGVLAVAREAVGAPIDALADLLADEVPLVMSALAREGE